MSKPMSEEYENLLKRKNATPGIEELMLVYGRYEELIRQTRQYFERMEPKFRFYTTNSTEQG